MFNQTISASYGSIDFPSYFYFLSSPCDIERIEEYNMTEEEKENHPEYKKN
jgi:hypothetical protein